MALDTNEDACRTLFEICQRWADRHRPANWPQEVPIKRLPRPGYEGSNAYNGFTAEERKTGEQVAQVLRRTGTVNKPNCCDICGKTERIGFHGEDYFDPFSYAQLCFSCHMALHRRFTSPDKWCALLDRHVNGPRIADYRDLPMIEVDFASWLRANTSGPHDVIKRVWGDRDVPQYQPRRSPLNYLKAVQSAEPSVSEIRMLQTLLTKPGATSSELSAAMGWKRSGWQLHFGSFCKRLEADLGPAPTVRSRRNEGGGRARFYIGLLADFDTKRRSFTMKNEVQSALQEWLARQDL